MKPFRSERLANGVVLDFFDRSNRYFGDYHRVCVDVHLSVPHPGEAGGSASTDRPGRLQKVHRLERMAVPGAEVLAVRDRLAGDFLRHAGSYLASTAYPHRLADAPPRGR